MHPNGCYNKWLSLSECAAMGCSVDEEKHTFVQSCNSGNIPFPEEFPECPPGWEVAPDTTVVEYMYVVCPDQATADTCLSIASISHCLHELGCVADWDLAATTYEPPTTVSGTTTANPYHFHDAMCVLATTTTPPSTVVTTVPIAESTGAFVHIGNDGCPEGFMLEHNNGSLVFDCQVGEVCGTSMACNNFGDCTSSTSCYTAEEKCQGEMMSGDDPTDVIGSCAYWGCFLRKGFY